MLSIFYGDMPEELCIRERILDYRDTYGPFAAPEDLKNVSGIGDKTFEKMKDKVCV